MRIIEFTHTYSARSRCFAAMLFLAANPLTAQTPENAQQYDVELVFFRPVNPSGTVEDWAMQDATANPSSAAPVTAPPATAPSPSALPSVSDFPALDAARFRLKPIADSLHRGKSYQLLAHVGWVQPGFALESTPPTSLARYLSESAVDGTASLARGRYLHLTLNLTYQAQDGKRYVMKQQRRMRSGEKHYFDHPYFGVIALLTPRG